MRTRTTVGVQVGLAVAALLGATPARADGTVELKGDEATVEGVLREGAIEVGHTLGFVLPREGPWRLPPEGTQVRAAGTVLPGPRRSKAGSRVLLRLDARTVVPVVDAPAPRRQRGLADALKGDEAELERLFARCKAGGDGASTDALLRAVAAAPREVRRRWAARLGEVVRPLKGDDPVRTFQLVAEGGLRDGWLDRDEWLACVVLWARFDLDRAARSKAAEWLDAEPARQALHTGLTSDLSYEEVARLLGHPPLEAPRPESLGDIDITDRIGAPIDASSHELRQPEPTAGALPPARASGPQLLDAGTWSGRAVNELFEELQDRLDELKAAVRARAKALNAKASLSEAEVQEFWDLRQQAAGAGYGAVDAVFTEEGGKAYKAWQASRCTGGRARVYRNYLALGGA